MEAILTRPTPATEVLRRRFDAAPGGRLYVSIPGAHLHLRGTTEAHANIAVSVAGAASERTARAHVEALDLHTRQGAETVRVACDPAGRDVAQWRRLREAAGVTVRVDIELPSRFNVDARASGGSLDVVGLEGRHAVEVNGGRLRAEDMRGRLEVFARSSKVDLHDFDGRKVDVHARSSPLRATHLRAETLHIETAGRPARLNSLHGPLNLIAAGAPVEIRALGGPLTARCYGAPLTLGLPSAADLRLAAPHIMMDARLRLTSGTRTPRSVEGRLAEGGPRFDVRALGRPLRCLADV